MPNFWRIINRVIDESDVVLEVIDSRNIEKTRNIEIEDKVKRNEKKLIYVFNKCDLVDIETLKPLKKAFVPSVFVSAKDYEGTKLLRNAILKNSGSKSTIFVGVLGYPNTGKSSIINALAGRSSAKTSNESGYTKGLQYIRVSAKIKLIDTPGVIPYREKDEARHGSASIIDYSKIKDPEDVIIKIMRENPGVVEKYYDVDVIDVVDETLEIISKKLSHLKKGGIADTKRTARMILQEWQKGKINLR